MNKDEYRAEMLKELREIKINTEVTGISSILADALLLIIMTIMLFK